MAVAHRIADAYEVFGYPKTRKCTDPKCKYGDALQPTENFSLKTRIWSDGRVVKYPACFCKSCTNRRKRERRERRIRENQEEVRKQERLYRERHVAKDPEGHREYQRIWTEAQRRKEGIPARNFKHRRTDEVQDKKLEVTTEFISWLQTLPVTALERQIGVVPSTIQKLARGERATIKLGVADRIIIGAGNHKSLTDFWPDA